MVMIFGGIVGTLGDAGFGVFSLFICLAYLPFALFDAYKMAIKDKRDYTKEKAFKLKGFLLGILSELPAIIILAYFLCIPGGPSPSQNLLYIIYMAPFLGFIGLPQYMTVYYFTALLFIPITTGIGYLLGYYNFSFIEKILSKILYKSNPKKRNY